MKIKLADNEGLSVVLSSGQAVTLPNIAGDLALSADVHDATTLTPMYSSTPTFTEWVVSGGGSSYDFQMRLDSDGWNIYVINQAYPEGLKVTSVGKGDALSTRLSWTVQEAAASFTAARIRTDIIGYTLGEQADKPLAAIDSASGSSIPLPFDSEVEYVTAPVGAFIPTGIIADGYIVEWEATVRLPASIAETGDFRIGTYFGDANRSAMAYKRGGNLCILEGGFYDFQSWSDIQGAFGTIGFKNRHVFCGSQRIAAAGFMANSGCEFTLFGLNGMVDEHQTVSADISSARLFICGALVRDFVPVRVGSVGYLYDKVTGKLFGSGDPSIPLVPAADVQPTIVPASQFASIDKKAFSYQLDTNGRAIVSSEESGVSACSLLDHAVNRIMLDSSTAISQLSILLPLQTSSARDFYVRFELESGTVLDNVKFSLPSDEAAQLVLETSNGSMSAPSAGTTLMHFLELKAGTFLVNEQTLSAVQQ